MAAPSTPLRPAGRCTQLRPAPPHGGRLVSARRCPGGRPLGWIRYDTAEVPPDLRVFGRPSALDDGGVEPPRELHGRRGSRPRLLLETVQDHAIERRRNRELGAGAWRGRDRLDV